MLMLVLAILPAVTDAQRPPFLLRKPTAPHVPLLARRSTLLALRGGKSPGGHVMQAIGSIGRAVSEDNEPGGLLRIFLFATISRSPQVKAMFSMPVPCLLFLSLIFGWVLGLPDNWAYRWIDRVEAHLYLQQELQKVRHLFREPSTNRILTAFVLGGLANLFCCDMPLLSFNSAIYLGIIVATYLTRYGLVALGHDAAASFITAPKLISNVLYAPSILLWLAAMCFTVCLVVVPTALDKVLHVVLHPTAAIQDQPYRLAIFSLIVAYLNFAAVRRAKDEHPSFPWRIIVADALTSACVAYWILSNEGAEPFFDVFSSYFA